MSYETLTEIDGQPLVGGCFEPAGTALGTVVIAPAMGTPQSFYAPLAQWLAEQGFRAVTFDYRGTGHSLRGSPADCEISILDWARQDMSFVLRHELDRADGRPVYWIGHSLGGQVLPFIEGIERVRRAVTVASGSGYWRYNAPRLRLVVLWLWYVAVPLSHRIFGYFPGKRLRKVGDVPRGAMAQWRRWCLDPEYAVGAEGARDLYGSLSIPITGLSFVDDEMLSARSIESLHAFYSGADRTMRRLAPEEFGVERIGHFGFFRKRHQQALWQKVLLPALV